MQNKGGEEERAAYNSQLQSQKAQRDRDFAKKLESITSTVPSQAAGTVNMDPYGAGDGSNTRDRLSMLKMRFDDAFGK